MRRLAMEVMLAGSSEEKLFFQSSFEVAPAPIPDSEIMNTVTADIVVIGEGIAGIVTALAAAEAGAKVTIIEKNKTFAARGFHNAAVVYAANYLTYVQKTLPIGGGFFWDQPERSFGTEWDPAIDNEFLQNDIKKGLVI